MAKRMARRIVVTVGIAVSVALVASVGMAQTFGGGRTASLDAVVCDALAQNVWQQERAARGGVLGLLSAAAARRAAYRDCVSW
ncbi:hypothetical protein [Rhodoplanes roseus]|uniref:Uncharacterized protein n=1 Tax=Rhodoplanes roseus TaxID=29409 RepID=A0A327KIP2_9BRAD|nr:hypothetical protein [Rhodoplanes roseus]RAI38016.1 hypothetical protein CH341_28620 [Rhodoplanes roseus]